MTRQNRKSEVGNDNVFSFVRSSGLAAGATALGLVYQAAEVFNSIEDRAREAEVRARALCEAAVKRLQQADTRIETAERVQREVIAEAGCRIQDASRALKQAEQRITAAEDRATAAEARAQIAEADAREAKRALALVEEAIRRRLLCASSEETARDLTAVA